MSEATTRAEWLTQIDDVRQTWETIVAEVGDAGLDVPGAHGAWSFKEVAAHLNGWRVRTVSRLEAAARDAAPPPPPWPGEMSDETDEGVDEINAWLADHYRDRSAAEVLAEAAEQFRRMRAAVEAIPEEALVTPGRYPWLGGAPLSAVIAGSRDHFYEEHLPGIRAWLAERTR